MIVGAREHFAKGRVNDAGLLKPAKKLLVDLVVSEKSLEAALDTANQLFTQLEHARHRVMLAPTDRLQACSPYALAPWSRQWRETSGKKLTNQAAGIVAELGDAAVEIARLVEEGERQAEIRQLAWEAERRRQAEEAQRARQVRVRKESLAELLAVISSWGEMKRMQAFFEEADIEAERLEPGNRELARERIRLARALIGDRQALDALLAWRSPDEP